MAFFEHLQASTEEARNFLLTAPIINAVYEGHFDKETYIAFLNQAYHHVRHTTPLIMAAGARVPSSQLWLQKTLSVYIQEEIGHDEWILDDLEALGCDKETFRNGPAPFYTRLMVSYLYDYINRINPVGILGMVQVLEGTSASMAPEVARLVQAKLNLPDSAMNYLTTHGELDQDHIVFFEKTVNKLESEQDQEAVIEVANQVYRIYGEVYRSLPIPAQANLRAVS